MSYRSGTREVESVEWYLISSPSLWKRLMPFIEGAQYGVEVFYPYEDSIGGERTTAPKSEWSCGAADVRYSAGGLINAIALRWRTNLGSFG